jgi:pimeloyl-ACP methyl ester carboxylesterase
MIRSAVGRTTPALPTFTSALESTTFSIKTKEDPPLGTTPDALARTYARFASFGTVAKARLKDIGPYVNTPFVARDMLAITKAHGFDKLKYWGISYGTVLGMSVLLLERTELISIRINIRFYVP